MPLPCCSPEVQNVEFDKIEKVKDSIKAAAKN
jgi:hypothetical protein